MRELPLETPAVGQLAAARINLRVKVGDRIGIGDIIAEMKTDLATMEMDSPDAFTLRGIRQTPHGYVLIIED